MRGDGVGVGDVSEVSSCARDTRHQESGDDGRRSERERDAGMVGGPWRAERDTTAEPCGHGVDVGDGAWIRDGSLDVHGEGAGGSDGMRGDGVGVGDVGAMPDWAGGTGHPTGGDDCWFWCWHQFINFFV